MWDSEGIQESEDRVLEQIFESVDAASDDDSESSDTKKKKRKHGKDGKKDKRNSSSDKSSDSSSGSGDKAHLFLIVALDFSEYVWYVFGIWYIDSSILDTYYIIMIYISWLHRLYFQCLFFRTSPNCSEEEE